MPSLTASAIPPGQPSDHLVFEGFHLYFVAGWFVENYLAVIHLDLDLDEGQGVLAELAKNQE